MSGEFDTVMQNFKQFAQKTKRQKTHHALDAMLMSIGNESQKMVPVATGKLVQSKFTQKIDTALSVIGIVGYQADYAKYVHEAPGIHLGKSTPRSPASLGNIWDKTGEPKFLEKGADIAMRRDAQNILMRAYK